MTTFFTADTHFSHRRICELSKRPFTSVEEHDEALIRRWNAVVGSKDIVYHLGDFCFVPDWRPIRDRLNGRISIVWGNHDHTQQQKKNRDLFENAWDLHRIKLQVPAQKDALEIVLCHYPIRAWNKCQHGAWHLFGHEHGYLDRFPPVGRSTDVGVDCWNYAPVSLAKLAALFADRNRTPHHGETKDPCGFVKDTCSVDDIMNEVADLGGEA